MRKQKEEFDRTPKTFCGYGSEQVMTPDGQSIFGPIFIWTRDCKLPMPLNMYTSKLEEY